MDLRELILRVGKDGKSFRANIELREKTGVGKRGHPLAKKKKRKVKRPKRLSQAALIAVVLDILKGKHFLKGNVSLRGMAKDLFSKKTCVLDYKKDIILCKVVGKKENKETYEEVDEDGTDFLDSMEVMEEKSLNMRKRMLSEGIPTRGARKKRNRRV